MLDDRLGVPVAHADVAAALVGEGLEGGVGRETQGDVARAGVGLDPSQTRALVLQADVAGAGVGAELFDVAAGDVHVAGAGGGDDELRGRCVDPDVARADVAAQAVSLEFAEVAVAAAGVADERALESACRHVARTGVRLDLPPHLRHRDVTAGRVEQDLSLHVVSLEEADQVAEGGVLEVAGHLHLDVGVQQDAVVAAHLDALAVVFHRGVEVAEQLAKDPRIRSSARVADGVPAVQRVDDAQRGHAQLAGDLFDLHGLGQIVVFGVDGGDRHDRRAGARDDPHGPGQVLDHEVPEGIRRQLGAQGAGGLGRHHHGDGRERDDGEGDKSGGQAHACLLQEC